MIVFNCRFRAEAFNVLNHPNFNNVDTGLGDGNYGQVKSAGDPRIMEFAMKLILIRRVDVRLARCGTFGSRTFVARRTMLHSGP